jgi:hypothetical protein
MKRLVSPLSSYPREIGIQSAKTKLKKGSF